MPEGGDFRHDAQNLTIQGIQEAMLNIKEVFETTNMIEHDNLDVRTVTMGTSFK